MKVSKSTLISQSNNLIQKLKEKDLLLFLKQGRLKICDPFSPLLYIGEFSLVDPYNCININTYYPVVCQRTGKTTYYLRLGKLACTESVYLWWADTLGAINGIIELE